jgi:hypothetical protein
LDVNLGTPVTVRSGPIKSTKNHYNVWRRTTVLLTEMLDLAKKRAAVGQPAILCQLLTCGEPPGGHSVYAQDSHTHLLRAGGWGSGFCPEPARDQQQSGHHTTNAESDRAE